MKLLTHIPCPVETATVLSRMNTTSREKHTAAIEKLLIQANEKIKPAMLYKRCPVCFKDESSVIVNDVEFNSRILKVNLENAKNAFVYIITCGQTYEDFLHSLDDMLDRYYVNEIGNVMLSEAQAQFLRYLEKTYALECISKMNPGSLEDWPLSEQKKLFALLTEEAIHEKIGVTLEENMLMTPVKTLSGIAFPTASPFENCQMCPQISCPGRKAPYDDNLKKTYF